MTTTRLAPFDPPEELRSADPIRRMTYADGHRGWLVTGYQQARAVLADRRFAVRPEQAHAPLSEPTDIAVPPGFFLRMDPPEHTRYRTLLTRHFTVHRVRALEPRVAAIVAAQLDELESTGRPADLVSAFALPVPSLVICELIGVPYADRARFQRDSAAMLTTSATPQRRAAAVTDLLAYLRELVSAKRAAPGDDLLSGLTTHPDLTLDELTGIAMLLLVAGHETTANMLALGMFALLCNGTTEITDELVEDLLRYLSIIGYLVRVATEDVEVAGQPVRAGESVTVAVATANRDPARFAEPDLLHADRSAMGHLAFGHGIHQCLGQQLARVELRIALPALCQRFPALRLAVPPQDVPMRSDMAVYGVHALPVTW